MKEFLGWWGILGALVITYGLRVPKTNRWKWIQLFACGPIVWIFTPFAILINRVEKRYRK